MDTAQVNPVAPRIVLNEMDQVVIQEVSQVFGNDLGTALDGHNEDAIINLFFVFSLSTTITYQVAFVP